jgi:putative ABC transport system permease protein
MRDWPAEIRARLARSQYEDLPADVVDEISHHLADLHRTALFRGDTVNEADRIVEAELSNITPIVEAIRKRRRERVVIFGDPSSRLSGLWRDVTHAWRVLTARRAHSTLVVVTLAVAIGSCTAVFSLVNSLIFGRLPYPDPDRLVLLWETEADDRSQQFIVAQPNYLDWVNETRSFAAIGAWEYNTFNVSANTEPEQVPGLRASASLFKVLGVQPALGRVHSPEEDAPGHRVAVISDGVWRVHFGADRSVIGRAIRLNGHVYEVIGVMPPDFEFPRKGTGIWIPIQFTEQDNNRGSHSFYVAGRLAAGVSFEQARDEVERLGDALRNKYEANEGESATVQRIQEYGLLNTRRILVALSGAVALVLLIACINVAGLQVALGLARRREFVTRLSIGARYAHLVRQVFVESLMLAALGCLGGLGLTVLVTRSVDLILSPGFRTLPFRGDVAVVMESRVLVFAVVVAVLSALLFGFAPLVGLRRQSLQTMLREGDRGATRLASGTRRTLVAVEVAMAIIVLCGAGLMIRSLSQLLQVDPGFDPSNTLVMQVSLPQADTYGPPVRADFCRNLATELSGEPGIVRASAISHLPLNGSNSSRGIFIEGRNPPGPDEPATGANYRLICPGYFATLEIPLLAGRDFTDQDVRDGTQVVILNRAIAEQYWPQGDALGKRFKLGGINSTNPWLTVIGIVDNVRHFALEALPAREIYRPYSQSAWPVMTVVARTAGQPLAWQRQVRDAIGRVELQLPAANPRSLEAVVNGSIAWRETPMRLLTGFAVVGLLLVAIGVYGVLAYYVSQRKREFGVRLALGASKRRLVALVLRQSALPVLVGVVVGVGGSLLSGRWLTSLLYEVQPHDPLVLLSIAGLLTLVAVASSWIPARRAAMVDPLVALREE